MIKEESNTTYEIPLTEAKNLVAAYQANQPKGAVKGFLIAADELIEILKSSDQVKYIRLYFGTDKHTPENEAKLLLVPVNIEGIDMINLTGANSNIYDFTMPCPPTCDPGSALFAPKAG